MTNLDDEHPRHTPPPGPHVRRSAALPWAVAAVAVVVAVLALVLPKFVGAGDGAGSKADAKPGSPTVTKTINSEYGDTRALERRKSGDPTALGRTDAPVVMIVFSDFQCPYCSKFARSTEKDLITKYVDAGVLRIEWRDFPYLGKESVTAAYAAHAAAEQGKFWEYHDALYAEQFRPNSGDLTTSYLTQIAERTGLDVDEFTKDMDSALTAKLVQHDFNEGLTIGISGTPSFLINGVPIIGAMPLTDFEKAIERAAKGAQGS